MSESTNHETPKLPDSLPIAPPKPPLAAETNPEVRKETTAQLLQRADFSAYAPILEEYLNSLQLNQVQKDQVQAASGSMPALFEAWDDIREIHVQTAEVTPDGILRAKLPVMFDELKAYMAKQRDAATEEAQKLERTQALERLDAAIAQATEPATAEKTPAGRDAATAPGSHTTETPAPVSTPDATPAAAPTENADLSTLSDRLLTKFKAATPEIAPEFLTEAEANAIMDKAFISEGRYRVTDEVKSKFGTFIRIRENGKGDPTYPVNIGDIEKTNGKYRWQLKDGKVVGFYVNEEGDHFQATRQLKPGTESLVAEVTNAEAWDVANNMAKYEAALSAGLAKDKMKVAILVNRGVKPSITVRRIPVDTTAAPKAAPVAAPRGTAGLRASTAPRSYVPQRPAYRPPSAQVSRPTTQPTARPAAAPTPAPASAPTQKVKPIEPVAPSQRKAPGSNTIPPRNYDVPRPPVVNLPQKPMPFGPSGSPIDQINQNLGRGVRLSNDPNQEGIFKNR